MKAALLVLEGLQIFNQTYWSCCAVSNKPTDISYDEEIFEMFHNYVFVNDAYTDYFHNYFLQNPFKAYFRWTAMSTVSVQYLLAQRYTAVHLITTD